MITCNCENCGKIMEAYESRKARFCCSKCWYEFRKKQSIKKCVYCDKEFAPKEQRQRFCCRECVRLYQTTLIGELSPKYNHINKKCEVCGKTFSVKKSKEETARFCSTACAHEWYTQYKRSDDNRQLASKRIVDIMDSGKMKRSLTKPHIVTTKILEDLNIKYECEYSIKYYLIDIYLIDSELMIEVMGDFWHSNPVTKYGSANTKQQKARIGKDKAKHSYVVNNYNIEILYLWETDILKRPEVCKTLIAEYILNNGILKDYNSFNYSIGRNDELVLNNVIATPLFAS